MQKLVVIWYGGRREVSRVSSSTTVKTSLNGVNGYPHLRFSRRLYVYQVLTAIHKGIRAWCMTPKSNRVRRSSNTILKNNL